VSAAAVFWEGTSMNASSSFTDQSTPCRRRKGGERYEDRDDTTLLTQLVLFSCGCRIVRHEYHDGCVDRTVVRHDGTVLLHELLAGQ
jgi:hypothetical protein